MQGRQDEMSDMMRLPEQPLLRQSGIMLSSFWFSINVIAKLLTYKRKIMQIVQNMPKYFHFFLLFY